MNNDSRVRIAIIVEVKKREMPFMSILQQVLLKKGYRVKLIPFRSLCTWRILFFRPDIILINGLRYEDPYFIRQIYLPKKIFKSKIACYYSEQVGWYEESLAKTYQNDNIFNNVDYHISWGPRFASDLINLGVDRNKMWFIGSLQYDIDKYLKISKDELKRKLGKEYGLPIDKKWIIYADNIIKQYMNPEYYSIRRKESYDYIKYCADINSDAFVIFRPHPDTPDDEIEMSKKEFKSHNNIKIIPYGHIFDWTCAVSAMIIWNSTSSIQALFMNIPVFGFITSDGKEMENYWYKDIFPTYTNPENMAMEISKVLNGEMGLTDDPFIEKRERYISDWYYKKDGLSFERLCFLFDIIAKSPFIPITSGIYYSKLAIVKTLLNELREFIGSVKSGLVKENNVTQKDINCELIKYDISKFYEMTFRVQDTKDGYCLL